jgi:hypothetical protein
MTTAPPCQDTPGDVTDVDLKQTGFEIDLRLTAAPTDRLLSGVAAGGVLTAGVGDFNPDEYVFGPIGPAKILLQTFSGRGCGILLTRK